MSKQNGPVVIEVDEPTSTPAEAPPVPDIAAIAPVTGRAMEQAIRIGARRPSLLSRLFWWLLGAIISLGVALWGWDLVMSLIARNSTLAMIATGLIAAFLLVLGAIALREWAGFARLRRLDRVRALAEQTQTTGDMAGAVQVTQSLHRLYSAREDMAWAVQNFEDQRGAQLDADSLLTLAEIELLAPLDAAARREVEAAARQVATVTALVPLALVDLLTALAANLRMIRRIAEIYGGRAGTLGSWRLTRSVLTHLVATGAVAVGDDLIGSVAGGSILSKFSRRFGEGIINGALTARVGVAAMDVCRPMPFAKLKRPGVTGLVQRALTGLFGRKS